MKTYGQGIVSWKDPANLHCTWLIVNEKKLPTRDDLRCVRILVQTHQCEPSRKQSPALGQSAAARAFLTPQPHVYKGCVYTCSCQVGNALATYYRLSTRTASWQARPGGPGPGSEQAPNHPYYQHSQLCNCFQRSSANKRRERQGSDNKWSHFSYRQPTSCLENPLKRQCFEAGVSKLRAKGQMCPFAKPLCGPQDTIPPTDTINGALYLPPIPMMGYYSFY